MIQTKKREQLINEFCANGKLEPYRALISKILDNMQANGVNISARYDVDFSNFEDYDTSDSTRIRVSLRNVTVPLDVVWILFHEYGHFLSPKRKHDDNKVYREELAWEKADKAIKEYPELDAFLDSYENCKKRCLNSYYREYGLPLLA